MSRMWGENDDDLGEDDIADDSEVIDERDFVVHDTALASVRLRGQVERDRLMNAMPA